MARKRIGKARLLSTELEVLRVLWNHGPSTIVEVQRGLERDLGYTTVQTRLNRMQTKRLVKRSRHKPARYSAALAAEEVRSGDLEDLVASEGSVVPLVAHLVRDPRLTEGEINELAELIDEAKRRLKQQQE